MTEPAPTEPAETPQEAPEPPSEAPAAADPPVAEEAPVEARAVDVSAEVKSGTGTATVGEFAGSIVGVSLVGADGEATPVEFTAEHAAAGIADVSFSAPKGTTGTVTIRVAVTEA